ncbi:[FeFe] hydrogenase H-cluster radical SAM maturase HydE [Desulfofundulus thermocisternus]|uniref:[FeFe] hydrogenase H-cluster radical SAM maturase HydE n=1 Tax=Desulfofundulus thermocisternus TaxID=42471 RepID=UPI0019F6AF63|nr:[FeFe] hydrogenase H-cluster radical SAM maturase HydE [Desulfofundulus thermocisternus]MBE3585215.1 [FeFe] hydrogenase H-cluster radical SAM maturase HydE [Thermoanaerobacter sp.]MCS5696058.1 [FeFe] hydrogenase H-cluster radical SAM maturase HydE [Desulfofundulus thermocisternus]
MRQEFMEVLEKARGSHRLERHELIVLLQARGEEVDALGRAADGVRAASLGDEVHLRGIIEFSNYCRRNCLYCGLRRDNRKLRRYRLTPGEILAAARKAAGLGLPTIVLQSGEDPHYTAPVLADIIRRLKEEVGVGAVTLSVGERSFEDYRLWREAGADRYLLKHETADAALFARLRPGTTLRDRLLRLKWLRELGYQVGSGNIVGLPGQSLETLAADILLMRELDVEMAGIGPFIPHPQTPLAKEPPGELELTLKVLAIARLLLPRAHLPATTALGTIHPAGRRLGLCFGANVIMPDTTPPPYRYYYQIYPGKAGLHEEMETTLVSLKNLIFSLNRRVGSGPGHSPKIQGGMEQ